VPVVKPVLFALAVAACSNTAQDKPRVEAEQKSQPPLPPPSQPDTAVGLPEVAGPGVQVAPTSGPRITIAKTGVLLGDHLLVPVVAGALDASVIVRDGVASEIQAYVVPLAHHDERATVAIERTLPCKLIDTVLHSASAGGLHEFGLAATQQGKHVIVPLTVGDQPVNERSLGMTLVVTRDRVKLWSASGLEGSESAPKLDRPLDGNFMELTKSLDDILARRFTKQRLADDKVIRVRVDEQQSAQVLLDSLAAVGKQFPDIQLEIGPL
jgi:hypothetical protein